MSAEVLDATTQARIAAAGERALAGESIEREDARWLFDLEESADIYDLLAWANRVRERFKGNKIHLCSIVNVKAGGCSENCRFCSQSASYQTGSPRYGLVESERPRRPMPTASPRWVWWRPGADWRRARCWTKSAAASKN
jgi:2-iminoacetate synthase ThiH